MARLTGLQAAFEPARQLIQTGRQTDSGLPASGAAERGVVGHVPELVAWSWRLETDIGAAAISMADDLQQLPEAQRVVRPAADVEYSPVRSVDLIENG